MPVLASKLRMPVVRRELVDRARLTDGLAHHKRARSRLLLVSAPAGFGKTTLLTQWLTRWRTEQPEPSSARVAWLSLDAADNDPRRLLAHLVASVQTAVPDTIVDAAELSDADGEVPPQAILTALVNELDTVDAEVVLALDDYHVIEETAVHDAVAFLLEHLPPQISLAIATRADPPLPLPRLRVRAELTEVRAADLRFTPDEAEVFLRRVMGLDVTAEQVAALDARTEGWVAGLQLAGLSLRGQDRPESFISAFTGSHRFVVDYLVEEVLDHQPAEIREFLLDTAPLDRMTGSLCDALTGRHDGQQTLELLERENLFVIPLDDQRSWFRYHHLFADALRARLAGEGAPKAAALHRAASHWYAGAGLLDDAIAHANAGGDSESAADLVELAVPEARQHRRDRVIAAWLRALPLDVISRRPVLSTQLAWLRLVEGDLEGLERCLHDAERALDAMPAGNLATASASGPTTKGGDDPLAMVPAWIAIYRASAAQARGDVATTAKQARRALELAGPEDHFARGGGAGFLGLAAWAEGDLEVAVDTFGQAVASLRAAGDVSEFSGTVVLGEMLLARGRPTEARRRYEDTLRGARTRPGVPISTTGDLLVGLADVLREQGHLEAAAEHLDAAAALGETGLLPENRHRWHLARAGLLRARGNVDLAVAELRQAESSYLPGFFPDVHPIAGMIARLQIAQGRLADAWDWARTQRVTTHDELTYLVEFTQLTLVRLIIAQHRAPAATDNGTGTNPAELEDAVRLLNRIVQVARAAGRGASVIDAQLVAALAHDAAGDREQAFQSLDAALAAGVPAGYVRLFLDEGPAMMELLRAAGRRTGMRTGAAELAESVLRAAETADRSTHGPVFAPTPEALSEREIEVLRLLATELSGPEIARRLYLSVNTFRTHTRHIFTKLNVQTRRAAVARAGELGLL